MNGKGQKVVPMEVKLPLNLQILEITLGCYAQDIQEVGREENACPRSREVIDNEV